MAVVIHGENFSNFSAVGSGGVVGAASSDEQEIKEIVLSAMKASLMIIFFHDK
ncbi:hypothetical protein [Tenacibaculum maritimum]|uniref:hypothetical protein n=1 Tax=Tenacibaculum maritimum TaxID=107401 RepID=UPI001330AB9F|nr:hypothetical protein [Tenacibaculum maritimum]